MGELPLFEQATFSIWDSIDHIKKFAYKDDLHLNIVKKAKEQNWYKEDLFARFLVKSDIIEQLPWKMLVLLGVELQALLQA